MKTIESLFRRFGSPAQEMNESIYIHGTRADCIKDMKHIQSEDERARRTISEMLEYIEVLKEYRKTLFARAQEICAASYRLQIKIKRSIDSWKNKKYYTVTLSKIYDEAARMTPENVIEETFDGKERAKALKRFEELRKEYPNTEAIKDIDKKSWER